MEGVREMGKRGEIGEEMDICHREGGKMREGAFAIVLANSGLKKIYELNLVQVQKWSFV